MDAPEEEASPQLARRRFLQLGALFSTAAAACVSHNKTKDQTKGPTTDTNPWTDRPPTKQESLDVWTAGQGVPYEVQAPGVCALPGPGRKTKFPDPDKYRNVERVHSMCQLCSTVCGITGIVKDGRIIKVEGNPNDPNSRGKLCARGQSALNHQYHPERLLYPLRRVGARGEGKWRRISWDEAYDEIAERLKGVQESGKLEEFAFHQGRSRTKDAVANFLRAFGTNTALNHRGLCSAARRAANLTYLFESDWDLGDYENSKYILNFGSNMFEAHQGHIAGAQRVQRGRFENGAKLVTFDVRMSNTAGNSDEFFMPSPGTDGAVALSMAHTILFEDLYDATFMEEWTNVTVDDLKNELREYTPAWAEGVSTVPAKDIQRIAREFAAAAPRATTMCNRGSSAHVNGYWNDRAIILLNALVGSVGKPGGFCWMFTGGYDKKRFPPPKGPGKPSTPSILADPPEFALANVWNTMKVGEIVYWYLKTKRAKIQVYMTYNLDSPLTWPETDVTRSVMLDEEAIGFHVCINPFLNETGALADMVLPWTTYLERWDVDARGAYNLKPYISMRRPMVESLGEAKDVREIFPEIARRVGGSMAEAYPMTPTPEYMAEWVKNVPYDPQKDASPMAHLERVGAFEDPQEQPYFEPYLKPLTTSELEGAELNEATGIWTKDGKGIGVQHRGKPVIGFKTPSRRMEVYSEFVQKTGRNEDTSELTRLANSKGKNRPAHHKGNDYEIHPWPKYTPIDEHQDMADNQLVMTSFKWNVHNHGRTANLKWCSEIVHSNPAWVHPDTAKKLGLSDGDFVELTGHRSLFLAKLTPGLGLGSGELEKTLRIPVWITPAVHPKAIAISNSLGHWEYTSVAQAKKGNDDVGSAAAGMDLAGYRDPDWERNMWWEDTSDGKPGEWTKNRGSGWPQNHILPIAADPISGQQAFHDTVVTVKKVS
ncbi:MAG: thiosulfate reductase/polysulfide reductase chain A [Pseudohongiellaceae bacterium]|jgi:thiosulfate reductase/polysulfide reductase chain A